MCFDIQLKFFVSFKEYLDIVLKSTKVFTLSGTFYFLPTTVFL
jgi:hypothetical protein